MMQISKTKIRSALHRSRKIEQNSPYVNEYRYRPLHHDDSIRVLCLDAGNLEDPLQCNLEEVQLKDDPQPLALSYTWGNPELIIPLYVQETRVANKPPNRWPRFRGKSHIKPDHPSYGVLMITQNLFEALKSIRNQECRAGLWVDAVCINQNDLVERSRQVQMMSRIYQSAMLVIVWLGPADDDSAVAFDWIEKASGCLADEISEPYPEQNANEIVNDTQLLLHWWDQVKPDAVQARALLNTFTSVGRRKWWERKWVIQEQAFARDLLFFCGARSLWSSNLFTTMFMMKERDKLRPPTNIPLYRNGNHHSTRVVTMNVLSHQTWKSLLSGAGQLPTICEAVFGAYDGKASDPRDEIYALLSMCRFPTRRIVPEYTKSILAIYREVTEVMIRDSQDLVPLTFRRVNDAGIVDGSVQWDDEDPLSIPSWLPDMRSTISQHTAFIRSEPYHACGDHKLDIEEALNAQQNFLVLRTICVDSVEELGQTATLGASSRNAVFGTLRDWLSTQHNVLENGPQMSGDEHMRLLLMDRLGPYGGDGSDPLMDSKNIHQIRRIYSRLREDSSESQSEVERVNALSYDAGADDDERLEQNINARVGTFFGTGRVLCRLKSGKRGWVTDTAQIGDQIHVVHGSNIPFVLRPISRDDCRRKADSTDPSRDFTMVCTAYVQDIMYGEVVADPEIAKAKEQVIRLY